MIIYLNFCHIHYKNDIVLFSMLLSVRLLFWVVSVFPVFLSDPCCLCRNYCFICRNPVLPWFLFMVPRAVPDWGMGGSLGWRGSILGLLGVYFNLPTRFPIPAPIPALFPAGDWGAELRRSFVSKTLQQRLRFDRLATPVISKGVLSFYLP